MEMLPTARAAAQLAELLGEPVNAQKFHRLAAKHGVFAVVEAPGLRGAKFWNPRDIDRLAELLEVAA